MYVQHTPHGVVRSRLCVHAATMLWRCSGEELKLRTTKEPHAETSPSLELNEISASLVHTGL